MYTEASTFCFNTIFFWCFFNPLVRTNKLVNIVDYHLCSTMCEKKVSIYGVPIRKWIESMHFYSCPSSPLKTPGTTFFLKIRFPQGPRTKGWRKLWFALLKFNQKIWRLLGELIYLYFVWFLIFLNVIAWLLCK